MNRTKGIFIGISILLVLFVSGCSGFGINRGNSGNRNYYQGYDSLDLKFSNEAPPAMFYYDPQGDNEIPIIVEVRNKGASDSYGAIYVHGYDPHVIQVAGGQKPSQNNVQIGGQGSMLSFSIGGIYIGLRGGGAKGTATGSVGFRSPNGNFYGISAFTQDGKVKGLNLNLNLNSGRIGSRLGESTLRMFSQYFGYNGIIALDGDTETTPGGGFEIYEFPMYIWYLPESLPQYQQNIMVTACYEIGRAHV